MKQTLLQETYPMFTLEVEKGETTFKCVDQIINFFKDKIDSNHAARYITTFDHYSHTKELEEGRIDKSILDAKNIIFCFGFTIPSPKALGLRPRSIGIAEIKNSYVISFMEAPMPVANVVMESWARDVRNRIVDDADEKELTTNATKPSQVSS